MTISPRRRLWLIMLGTIVSLLFLIKTGSWISAGCPMGHAFGRSMSFLVGGRVISASSDHLLGGIDLGSKAATASIRLGPTRIVVLGNVATIDEKTKVVIPDSCKKLEFNIWGDLLTILADERELASIPGR